jgi:type IV secretory pathway VirB10-like protein
MKKAIVAVLAVVLIIVMVCVVIKKSPDAPPAATSSSQTATNHGDRTEPRLPEAVPVPAEPEPSTHHSLHHPASAHDAEPVHIPASAPSTTETAEPNMTLPKDHIAWSQERQMRQLLEMNPEQVTKFRHDYESWIGGKLARGAKIDLTPGEIEQLTEVFMDATMDFCRQWQPILKDALAQPGEARDRLALLNAVDPDMMLMLYAIPARQNEISEVVGAEGYEKMHSLVNAEFQEWYRKLTNSTETIQQQIAP